MESNEFGLYHWINPYVQRMLEGPTGFCVGGIKLEDPVSSAASKPGGYGNYENDIFNIAVPLAGDIVRWQFIFDGTNPNSPPDVLLPDYEDFDPEFDEIPSLCNWDKDCKDSLLLAVQQIISLYKEHHKLKCLNVGDKFKAELEDLLKQDFNVEVSLKKSERTGNLRLISVLVQIPTDFSAILEKNMSLDSVIHTPLLLIKYEIDVGKVTPTLFLPSHVEQVIVAPTYTPGISMVDYVLKTKDRLHDSVKILAESYNKRKEYIAAFLNLFSKHIIEYDAEKFLNISLLFSFETFYFFIHVHLSKLFPNELPVIIFQSAYHFTRRNQLFQSTSCNYPYSPRWSGSEMAKRAKIYIEEKISQFKDHCIQNGSL